MGVQGILTERKIMVEPLHQFSSCSETFHIKGLSGAELKEDEPKVLGCEYSSR